MIDADYRYRWACEFCRRRGRWLKDPDTATTHGRGHNRRYRGHASRVFDNGGEWWWA